jgi:hypothetical protein
LAGRASYAPPRRLTPEQDRLVFDAVLGLHGPRLSHAAVRVDSGSRPPEDLPADASQAALKLRQLAATASRPNDRWYRRALAAGIAHLDLQDSGQLDLLRRYGPFSIDLRTWVEGDPLPVVQAAETLDGQPRVTYRLDTDELDRLHADLEQAGLADSSLVPRRSRAEV